MNGKSNCYLCFFLAFLILFSSAHAVLNEVRCGPVDIRNGPKIPHNLVKMSFSEGIENATVDYRNCTIIEGDVSVNMIKQVGYRHEDFPVFENLREVTGSVLVFHVATLKSLGWLFPNLRVIGGSSLIMNYALVVYQNFDLRTIDLPRLTTIKNGGVRIMDNPMLCNAKNINWEKLMVGQVRDYIVDQVAGYCKNSCTLADSSNCERDFYGEPICWSDTSCQRKCPDNIDAGNVVAANSSGCTDAGEPCHAECLGGCFVPNNPGSCFTCRHVDLNGVCVNECPPDMYIMLNRRCLTRKQCENSVPHTERKDQETINEERSRGIANPEHQQHIYWKPFQKKCVLRCPPDYITDPNDVHNCVRCNGPCPKKCRGDTVDSVGTALTFKQCKVITGNLEIDMRIGLESAYGEKFTEAFGDIEEIEGYLVIRFSTAMVSLHMFKNLKRISGKNLWKNMYALIVFENPNLRKLFQQTGIEIANGKVSFQNNRMLCYGTIMAFVNNAIIHENITEYDVSSFSNGDKAICDEFPLDVKVTSESPYILTVSWTQFDTTDMDHRKFLGYQVFYKKVDKIDYNMSIDDNRSACADSWEMIFVTEESATDFLYTSGMNTSSIFEQEFSRGTMIGNGIEADTLYAIYVQTRVVNHPGARNAISKIHFIRTLFAAPESPRNIKAWPLDANTLKIEWELPIQTNGLITHYQFTWWRDEMKSIVNETLLCTARLPKNVKTKEAPPAIIKPQVLTSSSSSAEQMFLRDQGCCQCAKSEAKRTENIYSFSKGLNSNLESEKEERANFENSVQNAVFVQKSRISTTTKPNTSSSSSTSNFVTHEQRKRRSVLNQKKDKDVISSNEVLQKSSVNEEIKNNVANSPNANSTMSTTIDLYDNLFYRTDPFSQEVENRLSQLRTQNPESTVLHAGRFFFDDNVVGKNASVNVTTRSVVLTGLKHYTEYQIKVSACQDETAIEHFCSQRVAWIAMKTHSIVEYDHVEPDTVKLVNVTDGNPTDRKIYWQAPKRPNGFVLTYRVKLFRDDNSTPLEQCIPAVIFEANNGILFSGLSAGSYSLEIKVESTGDYLGFGTPTIIYNLFEIASPTFFTLKNILLMAITCLLILFISTALCFRYASHQVKHVIGQNISNNPDYMAQYLLYNADEWELNRDDVELINRIGNGTFGMVHKGKGKDVKSRSGVTFGLCAVKMMNENLKEDRNVFLLEADMMKRFNTAFIVKLYGVVSNGSPIMIVMELMEKGNLRDYLRARRPNGEENMENFPPPTLIQYFTWAAQIADGMSYLEAQDFCHRDLAARNCMVDSRDNVKIGDFGMARDVTYGEYYKPTGKRMMPIRWMPPEALRDGSFTVRSDVWSYGIVLFEMLTLGEQPYGGLSNDEVQQAVVVKNFTLPKPANCHIFWYSIMRSCWQRDSRRRPKFWQIVLHLYQHATDEFRQLSFVLNHLEVDKSPDENYDFNQPLEENRDHDIEKYHKAQWVARNDAEDPQIEEKRVMVDESGNQSAPDSSDDAYWLKNGNNDLDARYEYDRELNAKRHNARLSIASRAIKKARELGAPFIGSGQQYTSRSFNPSKWTVLATLLGLDPMGKHRKKNSKDANIVINEGFAPLATNEYKCESDVDREMRKQRLNIRKEDDDRSSCLEHSISSIASPYDENEDEDEDTENENTAHEDAHSNDGESEDYLEDSGGREKLMSNRRNDAEKELTAKLETTNMEIQSQPEPESTCEYVETNYGQSQHDSPV